MLYRSAPGPTLARLDGPTAAKPTSLAVLADPHVTPWATGTWKVFHRTVERLRTALTAANRLDVDAVAVAGDLTKDGAPQEFDRAAALLDEANAPVLAVPGTHDLPRPEDGHRTPPVGTFADRFANSRYPFVERVSGVDLVGIDTVTAGADRGFVSPTQLDWLESILPALERPVVLCHHALTPAPGDDPPVARPTGNAQELARVLEAGGVELVVSGSRHWPGTGALSGVREVIAPAVCSLPQAFLHVRVGASGTTVDLVPLADRTGFEEAYASANDGDSKGQWVADRADRGALSRFPLVDDRSSTTAATGERASPNQ
ncbi:metallophosphoesterase family protein [Halorientalis sp.]|uniref:metallophosphoesterase family protein n=1 Tax=Halorientalis sp. TaxID=1931229 RepID=UPI00262841DF|nr:metallophosphoesterase [Halorientalis sp.]